MSDLATPNLPSRDFPVTEAFYHALGFVTDFRDHGWMILRRDTVVIEFFPFPDLDPCESSFGACIRVADIGAWSELVARAGIPQAHSGMPRYSAPRREASGLDILYLVDPEGSLIRIIAQP